MSSSLSWLNIRLITFNCARNIVDANLFGSHLLKHGGNGTLENPEILVLCLQEVAPIGYAFLGGFLLEPYFEAFRLAVEAATRDSNGYKNIITHNAGMTAIMVFVRDDVIDRVSWTDIAGTGVGIQNAAHKGAVGARISYQIGDYHDNSTSTILTFVSAHLAPGENGTERRNEDWKAICQRLIFSNSQTQIFEQSAEEQQDEEGMPLISNPSASHIPSGIYLPNSYLFVAGDFNYRTSGERPGINDHQLFPRRTDDVNHPQHFTHLLPHDQLIKEQQAHNTMHHLSELPINFPPSYKYSIEARKAATTGTSREFSWAKNRWPSWCDRILYLENPSGGTDEYRKVDAQSYDILPLFPSSDHRPVVLSVAVPLMANNPELEPFYPPPFDMDPDWQANRSAARTKEICVGILALLALTWEGNALGLAICLAMTVGYYALKGYFTT